LGLCGAAQLASPTQFAMNALLSPPLAATTFEAGPRVLFVDDSELLRLLVSLMLREHGYEVETAHDGFDGWHRTAENLHAYDFVITDLDMPRLNGLELIRLLRENGYHGRVVVYSGSICPSVRNRLETLGVDAVVPKDASPGRLIETISTLVGQLPDSRENPLRLPFTSDPPPA
jgi:two-component system sensor histidine kinase and response regulator WspE